MRGAAADSCVHSASIRKQNSFLAFWYFWFSACWTHSWLLLEIAHVTFQRGFLSFFFSFSFIIFILSLEATRRGSCFSSLLIHNQNLKLWFHLIVGQSSQWHCYVMLCQALQEWWPMTFKAISDERVLAAAVQYSDTCRQKKNKLIEIMKEYIIHKRVDKKKEEKKRWDYIQKQVVVDSWWWVVLFFNDYFANVEVDMFPLFFWSYSQLSAGYYCTEGKRCVSMWSAHRDKPLECHSYYYSFFLLFCLPWLLVQCHQRISYISLYILTGPPKTRIDRGSNDWFFFPFVFF